MNLKLEVYTALQKSHAVLNENHINYESGVKTALSHEQLNIFSINQNSRYIHCKKNDIAKFFGNISSKKKLQKTYLLRYNFFTVYEI